LYTRIKYLIAIIASIVLGLSSRKFSDLLPILISKHAGDMLWASMVYFGFRFFFIQRSLTWAVGFSVLFSFAIEFSQLYKAEWIIELRNTIIGSLILGSGFLTVDLIRYVLGITIAFGMDKYWLKRNFDKIE
jgi:glycopeptide antibiotics resistance protein